MNKDKIILDLCGGTGSWARPYKEAGYDVRTITLPDNDVRKYVPPKNVYGILAAPPCTMFSFARTNAKTPRDLKEGMECVRACLSIIWSFKEIQQATGKKTLPVKFWALENPYHGFVLPPDAQDQRKLLRNAVYPPLGKHILDCSQRTQQELLPPPIINK